MATLTAQDIKIEKGIKPPPPGAGRHPIYPLRTMAVGDSFTVPLAMRPSLSASISNIKRDTKLQFTTRKEGDLVRVWRIK